MAAFSLLILYGCGSNRKAVYTEDYTVRADTSWKTLSYLHGKSTKLTDIATTDMGIKIKYTRYDTDKSKDAVTGLQPIEEEGEVEIMVNREQKTDTVVADSTHIHADIKSLSKTETGTSVNSVTEHEETNIFNDLKWAAFALLSLALLLMLNKCKR